MVDPALMPGWSIWPVQTVHPTLACQSQEPSLERLAECGQRAYHACLLWHSPPEWGMIQGWATNIWVMSEWQSRAIRIKDGNGEWDEEEDRNKAAFLAMAHVHTRPPPGVGHPLVSGRTKAGSGYCVDLPTGPLQLSCTGSKSAAPHLGQGAHPST